jgi:hypothetical protein
MATKLFEKSPVETVEINGLVQELKPRYAAKVDQLASLLYEKCQKTGRNYISLSGAREIVLRMVLLTDGEILR